MPLNLRIRNFWIQVSETYVSLAFGLMEFSKVGLGAGLVIGAAYLFALLVQHHFNQEFLDLLCGACQGAFWAFMGICVVASACVGCYEVGQDSRRRLREKQKAGS